MVCFQSGLATAPDLIDAAVEHIGRAVERQPLMGALVVLIEEPGHPAPCVIGIVEAPGIEPPRLSRRLFPLRG